MNVITEPLENCEVLMTVEIDDKKKQKLLEKAARRIAKEVKIPGFRPGKAPYNFIVNRFGLEAIQEEAMEELTQDVFQAAIKEADLTPFALASLDSIEWEPLVMKVKVPVEPVVELGDYKSIRLDLPEVDIAPEEIDKTLESMREHYATFNPVERPAEMGDLVSITITEKLLETGELVTEDEEDDYTIEAPAEDDTTPDMLTPLIGVSAGETKTFTATYAEDDEDEKLAGKEVEFTITVNAVKVKEEVELDDDFAALVGDYDSLDALKTKIEEDLVARKQQESDKDLLEEMLSKVIDGAEKIEWPKALEEEELDGMLKNQEARLKQMGLDLVSFLKGQQKTVEEVREEARDDIRESIKRSLVLSKVAELESVKIDPQEIMRQAEMMVAYSGGTKQAREAFQSPGGINMLANNILTQKSRERLLAIAKGEAENEEAEVEETEEAGSEVEDVVEAVVSEAVEADEASTDVDETEEADQA